MTANPLDDFVADGLRFLEGVSGEEFTFRNAPYTGQISGLGTQQDWIAGGDRKLKRCTIVFTPRAAFPEEVRNGERVVARGITMRIESFERDGSSYQFECVQEK